MKSEHKKYAVVGGIVTLLLVVGFFVVRGRSKAQTEITEEIPAEDVIPTVDASVKVNFETNDPQNRTAVLSVSGIPVATDLVEYELSYLTASQGLQGIIGTFSMEGKRQFEKELTMGTCSSGTCVYHQVVGKIKLTLKFNGDYGAKLFEKEFEL